MISRMMWSRWLRPFFGGMNSSTLSLKKSAPTLSLLIMAEKLKTAAISAIRSLFVLSLVPKKTRTADVDQKDDRHLPLLLENLDVRRAQTGGHIPVHRTHIVPVLVLTHLAEGHSTAFEGTVIFTGEDLVGQSPGADLYLADLAQEFIG